MDRPTCGKCGQVMTPEDSRIHPEWFLHDACLPTAQPDRNVEIARILGLQFRANPECGDSEVCWREASGRYVELPDYEHDPAFILRTMEVNGLHVRRAGAHWYCGKNGMFEKDNFEVYGKSIPDAVLSWIVAAAAAGIKVAR
jgi:hypothetical protein